MTLQWEPGEHGPNAAGPVAREPSYVTGARALTPRRYIGTKEMPLKRECVNMKSHAQVHEYIINNHFGIKLARYSEDLL